MLRRKMLRDIRLNFSQFVTIFLMVMIGIMAYSGIEAYMTGMEKTADTFYKENNLQDLNLISSNFSEEDLKDIKNLNNVVDAERKLSITASTDNDKTLLLNFIESNNISKFYIYKGEDFDVNTKGVWLDNYYAIENNLSLGDIINITYDNYTFKEKIVGFVNIPDHLYDVKDASELYPNREEFGFAYLSSNELEEYIKNKVAKELNISEEALAKTSFDYKNNLIFNNIIVDVDKKSNVSKVKDSLEENITSIKAIIKIEDTSSYTTYQGEIDEGKTYVGVFSGLFLFIAMLSVITTMTRVVKKQRIQIGTLKALGFKDSKIVIHYISYGFLVALIGAIFGLILGYFGIGNMFINLEMSLFEIPNGKPVMETSSYVCAILVILCVCVVSYMACRKELKEKPAESLRQEIPKVKNGSLNITTKGMFKKMSFSSKWNIRDIFRNKIRTITGVAGITGCCVLIVCAFGMLDSMNYFIDLQFNKLYNFNYKLNIKENINENELKTITNEFGNYTSESYLIEFMDGDKKISNNLFVTDAKDYIRFVNKKDKFIELDSNNGVYITSKLADTYNYKIGDIIKWHLVGNKTYYESKIIGFNKDPQNQNMTMTKEYYESLGNKYIPDSIYTNKNLSNIKKFDNIELIQNKESLKESMSNMLSNMKSMIILIIAIAILLGAIIIYNLGILSYTEKQYQFATLKVLGLQDNKIRNIFVKQNNIITCISIILGLPLGYYLTDWLFKTAIEDSYDFSANISIRTFILSAIGTFLISYIVSKLLSRKINKIDMVSSLKSNE